MNVDRMGQDTFEFLTDLSHRFGTGNVTADVLFSAIILSLFSLLLGLIAYRRSNSLKVPPGYDRISSIGGRVEKLEMTLNEFRTDVLRSIELFRADAGFLRQELEYIRKALSGDLPEGGFGGPGFGGPPTSGGGGRQPGPPPGLPPGGGPWSR